MSGSTQSTLLLYRHILKAAKSFPSIKKNKIIVEIKTGFRSNAALMESAEINKHMSVAIKGLSQLSMYSDLKQNSGDWSVDLEKNPMPRGK